MTLPGTSGLFREKPYSRFEEFIAPGADRFGLLCSILEENRLAFRALECAGKRHVAAVPETAAPKTAPPFVTPPVIFAAHYDRTPDSPGANDNSAAVFMLIEAAKELAESGAACGAGRGAAFIFTDKEELSPGEGINEQGAYSLALYLRRESAVPPKVFCFDACGAGDTLVISTAADSLLRNEAGAGAASLCRRVQGLRTAALEAAREARVEKAVLLPTPFSDDAGFLKAGLAAQTLTVLPSGEAAAFASLARTKGGAALADRRLLPETWRSLNGPGDSPLRLTPRHWKTVVRFAASLAAMDSW